MDAKRILVLSDTHRHRAAWECALKQAGPVDEIFHLGDNVGDAAAIADQAKIRVTCVKGNCDFGGAEAEELVHTTTASNIPSTVSVMQRRRSRQKQLFSGIRTARWWIITMAFFS